MYAEMFTDISLQSMELQQFTYSKQALAAVVAARKVKNLSDWTHHLEQISGYKFKDIEVVYKKLFERYQKIMQKKKE